MCVMLHITHFTTSGHNLRLVQKQSDEKNKKAGLIKAGKEMRREFESLCPFKIDEK